jgi:hypothetical protein
VRGSGAIYFRDVDTPERRATSDVLSPFGEAMAGFGLNDRFRIH